MIDASWIKRHIKAGTIRPVDGVTQFNPRWPYPHQTRTLWSGVIDGFRVSFYPNGREIDMNTMTVRAVQFSALGNGEGE